MKAINICSGIFSLRYTCICMVISNIDRLSLIHRGHLYLTHKTLLVPQRFFLLDDVYPLGAILKVCCAIK